MASLDPRRVVSLRGATYRALYADCQARGCSVSGRLELLIAAYLSTSHPAPPSNTPATQAKQPGSLPRAKDAGSSKPAAGSIPCTSPPAEGSTELGATPTRVTTGGVPAGTLSSAPHRGQGGAAAAPQGRPNTGAPICANCGKKSGSLIHHDGEWWCPIFCVVPKATREPERVRMVPRMPGGTVLL